MVDTVVIDKNGVVTPGNGFYMDGHWGVQRLSDLTPLDYFVEPVSDEKSNVKQ